MRYQVTHTTVYSYSDAVPVCQNEVHLKPRRTTRQTCLSHRLVVLPAPRRIDAGYDYFGNDTHFFTIEDPHGQLSVTAESEVELVSAMYISPEDTPPWEQVRDNASQASSAEAIDVQPFVFDSPYVAATPKVTEFAVESFPAGRPWMEAVLDLTWRIHRDFQYDPGATIVGTSPDDVVDMRRGVCQDFAHLQIGCLRSLGLPARYVSGYLLTTPSPGRSRLVGADASHAWLAGYCPGLGWVDFDPTNNLVPSLDHITAAWGRDYGDVCPIKGVFVGGGQHQMRVAVEVRPLAEAV